MGNDAYQLCSGKMHYTNSDIILKGIQLETITYHRVVNRFVNKKGLKYS